jgi:hypothetical protein
MPFRVLAAMVGRTPSARGRASYIYMVQPALHAAYRTGFSFLKPPCNFLNHGLNFLQPPTIPHTTAVHVAQRADQR